MTVTEVVCVRNFQIWVWWAILHWIRRFAKVNVDKVNIFYIIQLKTGYVEFTWKEYYADAIHSAIVNAAG